MMVVHTSVMGEMLATLCRSRMFRVRLNLRKICNFCLT